MSGNDNAMTRFLFAILQQKCLKDIDWNKVARDPILAQEITNGHAARMRYSRFRAAMLGLEPQRRNRKDVNRSRVSKNKKEGRAKKEPGAKQDPDAAARPAVKKEEPRAPSPFIKQEQLANPPQHTAPPGAGRHLVKTMTAGTIPPPDLHSHLHTRLLTPSSDTDVLSTPHGFAGSPTNEMLHPETRFDFSQPSPYSHDALSWHRHPTYAAFGVGYDADPYAMGICQHGHQGPGGFAAPGGVMGACEDHVMVKHEEWDAQRYR